MYTYTYLPQASGRAIAGTASVTATNNALRRVLLYNSLLDDDRRARYLYFFFIFLLLPLMHIRACKCKSLYIFFVSFFFLRREGGRELLGRLHRFSPMRLCSGWMVVVRGEKEGNERKEFIYIAWLWEFLSLSLVLSGRARDKSLDKSNFVHQESERERALYLIIFCSSRL